MPIEEKRLEFFLRWFDGFYFLFRGVGCDWIGGRHFHIRYRCVLFASLWSRSVGSPCVIYSNSGSHIWVSREVLTAEIVKLCIARSLIDMGRSVGSKYKFISE